MNALSVQYPRHKCDLGNKNDSVTDKKVTALRQYLTITIIITIIIHYICVFVRYNLYIKYKIRCKLLKCTLEEIRKQFCGFNHLDEMKWVELKFTVMAESLEPA